jgi:hypothetical protein
MRALKCAVTSKKLKRYVVILLLALLVVSLSGCVEDDAGGDEGLDLGEPVDVVTNYVGTEGFGIEGDVQDELEGEGSLYALVTEETEEESAGTALKQYAKFAEVTYLDENGNEIIKHAINDEFVDLSGDEIEQLKAHSVQEDQIIPLIENLGNGKYDLSRLIESTGACGWEYDDLYQYEKRMDSKKPYIITGIIPVGDGYEEIVIFNKAFLKEYKNQMCTYPNDIIEEINTPNELECDIETLETPTGYKVYHELDSEVCYLRTHTFDCRDIIECSPGKEIGVLIKKVS